MIDPEAPGDEQDQIDLRASEWVVLLSDRTLTDDEEAEFSHWLAADPRHRIAWQMFENLWATIPALPGLADAPPADHDSLGASEPSRFRVPVSRRAVTALAAVAAVFAGILVVPTLLDREQSYRTGVSQTQLITLEDGSQITLGPRSSLAVQFHGANRRVALADGEAFFEVVHNPSRPFYVEAGGARTKVLGTKFNVNHTEGSVRVGVVEGLVQVSRAAAGAQRQPAVAYLRSGQGAEIALGGGESPIVVHAVQAPGAWRDGRLMYDNSRLADLVADANRYYAPGVIIVDRGAGDLRITASFKPSEIATFMGAVGDVVPVKVTQAANGSFRITATTPRSGKP
ncbi:MAG: FecR domain-containing protein [Candidatus Sphingomonas phytovorans]|nr:FecR domain-containing protein [Sphingomonas sp.]WEK00229.1 MAG: FecR domain-containing protein [Sphingomonas sp.]